MINLEIYRYYFLTSFKIIAFVINNNMQQTQYNNQFSENANRESQLMRNMPIIESQKEIILLPQQNHQKRVSQQRQYQENVRYESNQNLNQNPVTSLKLETSQKLKNRQQPIINLLSQRQPSIEQQKQIQKIYEQRSQFQHRKQIPITLSHLQQNKKFEQIKFHRPSSPYAPIIRREVVPYLRKRIEYKSQVIYEPIEITYQDYYEIQHITEFIPEAKEQIVYQTVKKETIDYRKEYLPVQKKIIHLPQDVLEQQQKLQFNSSYLQGMQGRSENHQFLSPNFNQPSREFIPPQRENIYSRRNTPNFGNSQSPNSPHHTPLYSPLHSFEGRSESRRKSSTSRLVTSDLYDPNKSHKQYQQMSLIMKQISQKSKNRQSRQRYTQQSKNIYFTRNNELNIKRQRQSSKKNESEYSQGSKLSMARIMNQYSNLSSQIQPNYI